MFYLWLRALHLIAVIAWMAGLFYLPRLFVYHTKTTADSDTDATFKTMERRLYRFIMDPAMFVSWFFGIAMLADNPALLKDPSIHGKLSLVLLMTLFHLFLGRSVRAFMHNANKHSERFWRIANEVPTVLMIGIVILVIVRPFT